MILAGNNNEYWTNSASKASEAKNSDKNKAIIDMFANTKDFKDLTSYRLMRGVPDFGSLVQFNPYLSGYAAFIVCQIPKFMEELAKYNVSYNKLIANFTHILEYEFQSFDGLQDLSTDTITIGDDLNNINVISRVNMQGASEFSLTYTEKSGSPITKFSKLYLTGIHDPRTQVKTYHGLIHGHNYEPGFEKEVFTFLFICTDETMREPEATYLIIGAQINSADTDMYNYTKGDINKRDVTVKFSGYPIQSPKIDQAGKDVMRFLLSSEAGARQIIINSNNYDYTGTELIGKTLSRYGASPDAYPSVKEAQGTGTTYTASDFHG